MAAISGLQNTLNRIYFGTSKTGGCGNTSAYTLGSTESRLGPISNNSSALPSDATQCAAENGTCTFSGIREVWYGASVTTGTGVTKNYWKVAPASNGVSCTNAVFTDPIYGQYKYCHTRPYTGSWTPSSSAGLNTDGFFYSRVQVCNVNSSGVLQDSRDYGLCKQYPNGKYKPVGVIQEIQ